MTMAIIKIRGNTKRSWGYHTASNPNMKIANTKYPIACPRVSSFIYSTLACNRYALSGVLGLKTSRVVLPDSGLVGMGVKAGKNQRVVREDYPVVSRSSRFSTVSSKSPNHVALSRIEYHRSKSTAEACGRQRITRNVPEAPRYSVCGYQGQLITQLRRGGQKRFACSSFESRYLSPRKQKTGNRVHDCRSFTYDSVDAESLSLAYVILHHDEGAVKYTIPTYATPH